VKGNGQEALAAAHKKLEHHDFEEVIAQLRRLHAKGTHGKTVITWRGRDVVHFAHDSGRKPGEPLDF
jgi:translation initiation factor IF-3